MKKIFLFDLDNVLVYPGGYREALKATVDFFSRAMGIADGFLDDATIETFEAGGITNEWDSSAICVAVLLVEIFRTNKRLRLSAELDSTLATLSVAAPARPEVDLATWSRRIAKVFLAGGFPSGAALSVLINEVKSLEERPKIEVLLHKLLDDTRDFNHSPTLRVFQQYTLGSEGFSRHYGVPATFQCPSFISLYDRPALSSTNRDLILNLYAHGDIAFSIYTSRPCWPRTLPGRVEDYPPEAEFALDLLGLKKLPLLGAGHATWLALQHGENLGKFLKPSPVHALAAIGVSLGGAERNALESALAIYDEQKLEAPFDVLRNKHVEINVFEDSRVGILGVKEAANCLQKFGVIPAVKGWGIATNPEKRQALEDLGVPTFNDINLALQAAVNR